MHLCFQAVSDTFVQFQRNLDFIDRFSKKVPNIKFNRNPSSGRFADAFGQTSSRKKDGYGESNRRF